MKRRWRWVVDHQHKLLAYFWLILAVPSVLWWKESVLFVILLSLYANYESSRAADEARNSGDDNSRCCRCCTES